MLLCNKCEMSLQASSLPEKLQHWPSCLTLCPAWNVHLSLLLAAFSVVAKQEVNWLALMLQARSVAEGILATVALMQDSGLPCFGRGQPLPNLRKRFHLDMTEAKAAAFMRSTILDAYDKVISSMCCYRSPSSCDWSCTPSPVPLLQ